MMESLSSDQHKRVVLTLQQVEKAIVQLQEWNKDVTSADDYLTSPEGAKNLAANCMMIEAIGESFKKIDNYTQGQLLPLYPSIPWKAVKGIRDHIAHGYFEIDADIIFETITENLTPLLTATRFFLEQLKQ